MNNFLKKDIENMENAGEYLFTNRNGLPLKSIKKSFRNALEKAQIKNFRFHDIRHTFSTYLSMGGIDEITRAELMGHCKSTITSRYSHTSWERKAEAVEIMEKLCHVCVTQDSKSEKQLDYDI